MCKYDRDNNGNLWRVDCEKGKWTIWSKGKSDRSFVRMRSNIPSESKAIEKAEKLARKLGLRLKMKG